MFLNVSRTLRLVHLPYIPRLPRLRRFPRLPRLPCLLRLLFPWVLHASLPFDPTPLLLLSISLLLPAFCFVSRVSVLFFPRLLFFFSCASSSYRISSCRISCSSPVSHLLIASCILRLSASVQCLAPSIQRAPSSCRFPAPFAELPASSCQRQPSASRVKRQCPAPSTQHPDSRFQLHLSRALHLVPSIQRCSSGSYHPWSSV